MICEMRLGYCFIRKLNIHKYVQVFIAPSLSQTYTHMNTGRYTDVLVNGLSILTDTSREMFIQGYTHDQRERQGDKRDI